LQNSCSTTHKVTIPSIAGPALELGEIYRLRGLHAPAMADKTARIISKLGDALASGDYYGALQITRTAVQRKFDGNHVVEGTNLLLLAARTLAAAGKYREAFDLGDMLLKIAASEHGEKRPPMPLSPFMASAVAALINGVVAGLPAKAKNQLVTNDHVALAARAAFAKRALRWATANAKTGSAIAADDAARLQPDAAPRATADAKRLLSVVYLIAARAFRDAALSSLHSFMKNVLEARSASSASASSSSAAPAKLEAVSGFIHDAETAYLQAGEAAASASVLKAAGLELPLPANSSEGGSSDVDDLALREWKQINEKLCGGAASTAAAAAATPALAASAGSGSSSTTGSSPTSESVKVPPMLDFSLVMALLALHAYRSETEIFACKPVLHLTAMGSLRDANRYREGWMCAAQLLSPSGVPSTTSAAAAESPDSLEWPAAPTGSELNPILLAWTRNGLQTLARVFDLPLPASLSGDAGGAASASSASSVITPLSPKEALDSPLCHFVGFTLQTCEVSLIVMC
jgi:hypothetical protein